MCNKQLAKQMLREKGGLLDVETNTGRLDDFETKINTSRLSTEQIHPSFIRWQSDLLGTKSKSNAALDTSLPLSN